MRFFNGYLDRYSSRVCFSILDFLLLSVRGNARLMEGKILNGKEEPEVWVDSLKGLISDSIGKQTIAVFSFLIKK